MATLTAEPGKVYYYETHVTIDNSRDVDFDLSPVDEDQGKYRVKAFKLATWKTK